MHRIQYVRIFQDSRYPLRLQCTTRSVGLQPFGTRAVHRGRGSRLRRLGYGSAAVAISTATLSAIWASWARGPTSPAVLDERKFTPFTIVSKDAVSSSCAIFTLRPHSDAIARKHDPYTTQWARGIWSVEFKQPQLQIARSYTPLPPPLTATFLASGDLRFLIRREHKGEVSGYLDRLPVGATVDIRGPRVEYEIPPDVSDVVFLAGGTGVAPALQAVHVLLDSHKGGSNARDLQRPRIHILWANRKREDCLGGKEESSRSWWHLWQPNSNSIPATPSLFMRELLDLEKRYDGQLIIDYFVDEEGTFIDKKRILRATNGKPCSGSENSGRKLLLISGPDGFIEYFAGSKKWRNGERGPGPVIGELGLKGWTVVTL